MVGSLSLLCQNRVAPGGDKHKQLLNSSPIFGTILQAKDISFQCHPSLPKPLPRLDEARCSRSLVPGGACPLGMLILSLNDQLDACLHYWLCAISPTPHPQIETVVPAEGDGASASHHVYRVFSTPIDAGTVTLGSSLPGSLPYFVLLYGGNHLQRHTSRGRQRPNVQRPLRASTDSGQRQRRRQFGSIFRKAARAPALGNSALGGRGGSGGSSINSLSSKSRGSSAGVVVSSAMQRGVSDESIELTPAAAAPAAPPRAPERRTSVASATSSIGAVAAAAINANPSWQLTPRYSLGGATRGVTSIATKADKHAKKAAGTAMKIAAISSAGTAAASAASGGAGVEVAKQPRVRLKVTLLCEHGIFVQMDDLHRLENTPTDDDVSPTFELALKVPPQGGGGGDGGGHDAETRSPGSLPPSMEQALRASLDFEHVASAEILGVQDSMDMKAAFGVEGRYFNPRVQQSEHFIEPWR